MLTEDRMTTKIDGHEIEVVARTGPLKARFVLSVDGTVQDETQAAAGTAYLDGTLPDGRAFKAAIKLKLSGLAGEEYWLELDGERHPMGSGYIL